MHGQHGHRRVGQLGDERIGHGVKCSLAGFVQRQFRCIRHGDTAQYRAHEGNHPGTAADLFGKALGQAYGGNGVGHEQLADVLFAGHFGVLFKRALDAGIDE
ncbi:hypothetical protein D3C76_1602780 [compost metagenome]